MDYRAGVQEVQPSGYVKGNSSSKAWAGSSSPRISATDKDLVADMAATAAGHNQQLLCQHSAVPMAVQQQGTVCYVPQKEPRLLSV